MLVCVLQFYGGFLFLFDPHSICVYWSNIELMRLEIFWGFEFGVLEIDCVAWWMGEIHHV